MIGFIVRRLLQSVLVVLIVTLIVFVLLHLLFPEGPARAILGPRASEVTVQQFNKEQGFDNPLPLQYLILLRDWATLNFGFSYRQNQSVASLLAERMPKTLILLGFSTLLTLIIAIPVGIYQAVRRNKLFDYITTALTFVGYAAPVFFIAIVAIVIFSQNLGWFPAEAPQGSGIAPIFEQFDAMILPICTLAVITICSFSRYMRSSVLDNINQDYVRTAYAKGASPTRVLVRHILRNALIPIVTLLGLSLPAIFAGALITESVFNFPGMGLLFWTAAQTQDYPIEYSIVIITAFATVIGNLLADIGLSIIDPRVALT